MAGLEHLTTNIAALPTVPRIDAPYDLCIDDGRRIIRSEARGVWTMAQADEYFTDLADLIEDCRRRFGRARVLADRRGCPVQSALVVERLGLANATLYGECDKLALVVGSSIAKSEMRRTFTHAGSQAFLSYTAAELWLTAWP